MRTLLGFLLFIGAASSNAGETPFEEQLSHAPSIVPQPDGVLCLNVEAAAQIRWIGQQTRLMNDGGGALRIEAGCITQ